MEQKKKKKKTSNKENKSFEVFGIIAIVVIVGALLIMVSKEKSMNDKNHIKEITYSEYKEIMKNDNYTIVLLASPTCSHCSQYKPLMNAVADKYNLDVYYVNVSPQSISLEEYTELHDSISILKNQYNDGEPSIPTPTTIILKSGVEVTSSLGNIGYDGFLNMLVENGVVNK